MLAGPPELLQYEGYDFAGCLRAKREEDSFNGLLPSESALATEWSTPEEDAVWTRLEWSKRGIKRSRSLTRSPRQEYPLRRRGVVGIDA